MHKESHQYVDVISLMSRITKVEEPRSGRGEFIHRGRAKLQGGHTESRAPLTSGGLVPILDFPPTFTARASLVPGIPPLASLSLFPSKSSRPADLCAAADRSPWPATAWCRGGAALALREWRARHRIPLAEALHGKGVGRSCANPKSLGSIGLQSGDYSMAGFDEADVVSRSAYDLVGTRPSNLGNPDRDKRSSHLTRCRGDRK